MCMCARVCDWVTGCVLCVVCCVCAYVRMCACMHAHVCVHTWGQPVRGVWGV